MILKIDRTFFEIFLLLLILFSNSFIIYKIYYNPLKDNSFVTTSTTQPVTTTIENVVYPIVKCNITSAKLYYLPTCPHCHRQLTDGTYDSLLRSGVAVELIDASSGKYNISAVPDWIINNTDNYGYHTWEELKLLFQCQ
jgi:hypothetical protein